MNEGNGQMAGWAEIAELELHHMPWRWAVSLHSVDPGDFRHIIAELKAEVPSRRRKWDPDGRRWLLRSENEVEAVISILGRYGVDYLHDDAKPVAIASTVEAYAALHLPPSAPPELVHAAHRCLAKCHHPDAGGTHAEMVRINAAADLLRQMTGER